MRGIRYAIITLLVVGAAVLIAFGPRSTNKIPTDRIVIEYWEKWTGREGDMLKHIVNEYNDGQGKIDGIYVNCLTTSEITKKTLVAIAGGTPPDVSGLFDYNLVQYASLNALEPLDGLIDQSYYKPVYWKMCTWDNHLYALVSTPATVALHYHKKAFQDNADKLRAAGLDPNRPPETLDELDAYAKVLDVVDSHGRIVRAGQLPAEPGWFLRNLPIWFGAQVWNEQTEKFQLTDPQVIKAYEWVASYSKKFYSEKLGKTAVTEFKAGLATFASPQNAFFFDPKRPYDLNDRSSFARVVMEFQGPWTANFIATYAPQMSTLKWPRNADGSISDAEWAAPHEERLQNYEWAVAPFPSAVPGMKDVTFATCDILVIPKGAKHKNEARTFLKWFNSQHTMEELCQLHSKNSPLTKVSAEFVNRHTNPYIDVFERLANSPNARTTPKIPINQEVTDELDATIQAITLLQEEPAQALAKAQVRLQAKYDDFMEHQRARNALTAPTPVEK